MQISVAEARARTRALLGLGEADDVAWVTEAYLREDAEGLPAAPPEDLPRRLYGIGVAWGWRAGVGPTFEFSAAAGNGRWPVSPDLAVGGLRWWAPQSCWRLVCEGGTDGPAFRRVGRFEWWG